MLSKFHQVRTILLRAVKILLYAWLLTVILCILYHMLRTINPM